MMLEGLLPSGSKDSQKRAPDAAPEWGGLQQNNHNKWDEASGKPRSLSSSAVVKLHISGCDLDCCSRSKLARLKSLYSCMPHFSQIKMIHISNYSEVSDHLFLLLLLECVCTQAWHGGQGTTSMSWFSLFPPAEVGSPLLLTGWLVCP